jgi:hypothetical protein
LLLGTLPGAAQAQPRSRCFVETKQCIEGRFLEYWEQNGGLAVFGYPVTHARQERNRDTGTGYLTQWFERELRVASRQAGRVQGAARPPRRRD